MNLPFGLLSIILVLAFYLPGYFFRKFYFSGFSTKQFGMGEWYDRFFISLFLGVITQFITILILGRAFHFNFETIKEPLIEVNKNLTSNEIPNIDFLNFRNSILYLLATMAIGSILGITLRIIIINLRLDVMFDVLRFANIWNYYFRGSILRRGEFAILQKKPGRRLVTRAEILMDFEKNSQHGLYEGILSHYDLSNKCDKLERIYLTRAKYKSIKEDHFVEIPGDIFMIDANRIININLSYDYKESEKSTNYIWSLVSIIEVLLFFSPVFFIPYFYYHKIGFWTTIGSVLLFFLAFFTLYVLIDIILIKKSIFSEKYKKKKLFSLLILFGLFALLAYCLYLLVIR